MKNDADDKNLLELAAIPPYNGYDNAHRIAALLLDEEFLKGRLKSDITDQNVLKDHEEAMKMLDEKNANGETPLTLAAMNSRTNVIKMLLRAGANPDVTNRNKDTPLTLVAASPYKDDEGAHNALIECGADLDKQNNQGNTALMLAAKVGKTKAVHDLCFAGAALDIQNQDGDTALTLTAKKEMGQISIDERLEDAAGILIRYAANVDLQNNDGDTVLLLAAKNSAIKTIKSLHARIPDTEKVDIYGQSVLYVAEKVGLAEKVKKVIKSMVEMHTANKIAEHKNEYKLHHSEFKKPIPWQERKEQNRNR